jgi:hypothetical protein
MTARWFQSVCGCLLAFVGVAKLWSLTGESTLLLERDPLLGIKFSHLMQLAASLELGVAAICFVRSSVDGLLAVAWLSGMLIGYRAALWWIGWQKPCSCLGNLTDALNVSPQLADNVMKGLLAFMFVGSVSLLFMQRRESRSRQVGGGDAVPSSSDEGVSSI